MPPEPGPRGHAHWPGPRRAARGKARGGGALTEDGSGPGPPEAGAAPPRPHTAFAGGTRTGAPKGSRGCPRGHMRIRRGAFKVPGDPAVWGGPRGRFPRGSRADPPGPPQGRWGGPAVHCGARRPPAPYPRGPRQCRARPNAAGQSARTVKRPAAGTMAARAGGRVSARPQESRPPLLRREPRARGLLPTFALNAACSPNFSSGCTRSTP